METFDSWLDEQYRYASQAMLTSISRTDLVKSRPGFGHSIRAAKGSVIASPELHDWDPDPDYFFHWFRDSALIMDALRMLYIAGEIGALALTHLKDFVYFSFKLQKADGRLLASDPSWREKVSPEFKQYLRGEAELSAAHSEGVIAETRVNADGTLDISRWTRPQHDGAPLRALTLFRWMRSMPADAAFSRELAALACSDLAFTTKYWNQPSYDMWEEDHGLHYHSMSVSAAALEEGALWLESTGEVEMAQDCRAQVLDIRKELDGFWLEDGQFYRSRILSSGERSAKELDIAVVFAAIHSYADPKLFASGAGTPGDAPHSSGDPRVHATLAKLEALFDSAYAINQNRPAERAPAMGRYAGDVYFSGGAYYFSTLGAAELCYRAALSGGDAAGWVQRGDAFLATVRAFTPPGGELSEQFDQRTGEQTSAKHLAWSYASFISCVQARRSCLAR